MRDPQIEEPFTLGGLTIASAYFDSEDDFWRVHVTTYSEPTERERRSEYFSELSWEDTHAKAVIKELVNGEPTPEQIASVLPEWDLGDPVEDEDGNQYGLRAQLKEIK